MPETINQANVCPLCGSSNVNYDASRIDEHLHQVLYYDTCNDCNASVIEYWDMVFNHSEAD